MLSTNFWDLNFGHILTIIILGSGGLGFVYTMRGRVDALTERMMAVETGMKQLIEILVEQGKHGERMTAMQVQLNQQGKRLDEVGQFIREDWIRISRREQP